MQLCGDCGYSDGRLAEGAAWPPQCEECRRASWKAAFVDEDAESRGLRPTVLGPIRLPAEHIL